MSIITSLFEIISFLIIWFIKIIIPFIITYKYTKNSEWISLLIKWLFYPSIISFLIRITLNFIRITIPIFNIFFNYNLIFLPYSDISLIFWLSIIYTSVMYAKK